LSHFIPIDNCNCTAVAQTIPELLPFPFFGESEYKKPPELLSSHINKTTQAASFGSKNFPSTEPCLQSMNFIWSSSMPHTRLCVPLKAASMLSEAGLFPHGVVVREHEAHGIGLP
jgi:hypothetical protein